MSRLQTFYEEWSVKDGLLIASDQQAASRKAMVFEGLAQKAGLAPVKCVLDLGCGYGFFLAEMQERLGLQKALGLDVSKTAIETATSHSSRHGLHFALLNDLCLGTTLASIDAFLTEHNAGQPFDMVFLVDLLEHVPKARALVRALAVRTRHFAIKLPLEKNFLDNVLLPKELPGPSHPDGHIREFDLDGAVAFTRSLGFIPLAETYYPLHIEDQFPPAIISTSRSYQIKRSALRMLRSATMAVLPSRLWLKCLGCGAYAGIFDYDELLEQDC